MFERRLRSAVRTASTIVSIGLLSVSAAIPVSMPGERAHRESATAEAPVPTPWLAKAERSIVEREYEATDSGSGIQAPNRAHGLRTWFEPTGARIVDRESDSTMYVRLRTSSIGRSDAQPLAAGEVVADGARVEVRRPGVVEWYENSERGLEQGWTLADRPRGEGPLAIEVDFGSAAVRVDGDRAVVISEAGRRLDYGGLAAWDANGSALAVHMEMASTGRVRIEVDDASATYPVTVDPTLTSPAFTTLMGDQVSAAMGYSVDGAGDVNGDGYDDVIVGAFSYDAGQTDEGAAFIYLGGPNGIASGGPSAASARLESNQVNAQMGVSVAGAGDVNNDGYDDVIVGALFYDAGQSDEGGAFIFLGSAGGIASGGAATAATQLESNQANALFGYCVSDAGDVNDDGFADVMVGAPSFDSGQTDEGGAFIFLGSALGIPSGGLLGANTILQSDQTNAGLGISVAGAGDTNGDGYDDVIAGARLYEFSFTDEGAVFAWLGGAAGIANGGPASASANIRGDQSDAHLGISVAGAGDVNNDGFDDVILGENAYDLAGTDSGLALVFHGGPSGIPTGHPSVADSIVNSLQAGANLGISVAGAGDVNNDGYDDVLVGSHLCDAGQTDEGAAMLILGSPSGVLVSTSLLTAQTLLQSDQASARLGVSVAGLGDVNGDGFADVAAGASVYASGQTGEGAAFIYLGSRDGLSGYPLASTSLEADQASAEFGTSVAAAGDVNNDGYDDVIVGAPFFDTGQLNAGAAFVFHGGPAGIGDGTVSTADAVVQSDQGGARLGGSVAGVGDTNGDGFADIIVGAQAYSMAQPGEGAAFVFHGGPSGIGNGSPLTADAILRSDQSGARLGFSVAGTGDVNNDSYADVIVGALDYDLGQTNEGVALVFHGGPSGVGDGTPSNADAILESDQLNAELSCVDGAGDTNGDGYDDVIVGSFGFDLGQPKEGAAFVFLGGPSGVGNGGSASADSILQSDQANSFFGFRVAGADDVNADGYSDVIVAADSYDLGQTDEGAAFVFLGGPLGVGNGSPANADAVLQSDQAGCRLGASVAGAGDVNADGYADVVVATRYGNPAVATALVYLGGINGIASGTPRGAAATLGRFSSFAADVAGAGDVDGDGFDDVIVGAYQYASGQSDEGGAFVFNLQRASVAPAGSDTIGIYIAASGAWFLRNTNSSGGADAVFTFGAGGGGVEPLRGDWDGDGIDTPGLFAPSTGAFFLRNTNSPGGADIVFTFGAPNGGYIPMVGDWDGDGTDTIGLYAPSSSVFFLRNSNAPGGADIVVGFGPAGSGWTPMSGDWDGNGTDTVGLFVPSTSTFFLRNANAPGGADVVFGFGPAGSGWTPLAGDFDGNGTDTVGLYSASNGFYFLRNTNAPGGADLTFGYGPAGVTPLVGDWDGM